MQVAGVADSNGQSAEQVVESTINPIANGQQQLVYTSPDRWSGTSRGSGPSTASPLIQGMVRVASCG